MSANSAPGFKSYPEHRITTQPAGVHVQVSFNGEVIADTTDAIRLDERISAMWWRPSSTTSRART